MLTFNLGGNWYLIIPCILSWIIMLGISILLIWGYLKNKKIFSSLRQSFLMNFKKIWFSCLICLAFIYCICYWKEVLSFTPFNGESLIFIFLLVLCLLPFVHELEGFGMHAHMSDVFNYEDKKQAIHEALEKGNLNSPQPKLSKEQMKLSQEVKGLEK